MTKFSMHPRGFSLAILLATVALLSIEGCIVVGGMFFLFPTTLPNEVLLDVLEARQNKEEFLTAQKLWQESKINDYQVSINIAGGQTLWFMCSDDILTVQNNIVVSAQNKELKNCETVYKYLTVEEIFKQVQRDLDAGPLRVRLIIEFDSQYGYITQYERVDYVCLRRGSGLGECRSRMFFSNLEPLPVN